MTLDYFYGAQADQFAFYRIPKALFTDERFKSISAEAKILYGILLDRMSLSRKNGWLDEQGRVFIIFTLEEVMEAIGCADQKATKLLNELDSKAGLIERKRQGLGKPNLIFVKNFVDNSDGSIPPAPESRIKTRENHDSADVNCSLFITSGTLSQLTGNTSICNTSKIDFRRLEALFCGVWPSLGFSLLSSRISLQNREKCRFEPTSKKARPARLSERKSLISSGFRRVRGLQKRPQNGHPRHSCRKDSKSGPSGPLRSF